MRAQSCPTLCDPMDCNTPGSSVHGIFQERIMEWVAISYFRGPGNQVTINTFPACIFGPGVSQKSFSPGHPWLPLQWNSLLFARGCSGSLRASPVALPPSLLSLVPAQSGGHVIWPLGHLVPVFLIPAPTPHYSLPAHTFFWKLPKVDMCPSILSIFCQFSLLPLSACFLITALLSFWVSAVYSVILCLSLGENLGSPFSFFPGSGSEFSSSTMALKLHLLRASYHLSSYSPPLLTTSASGYSPWSPFISDFGTWFIIFLCLKNDLFQQLELGFSTVMMCTPLLHPSTGMAAFCILISPLTGSLTFPI